MSPSLAPSLHHHCTTSKCQPATKQYYPYTHIATRRQRCAFGAACLHLLTAILNAARRANRSSKYKPPAITDSPRAASC